jgi:hypothetical protein
MENLNIIDLEATTTIVRSLQTLQSEHPALQNVKVSMSASVSYTPALNLDPKRWFIQYGTVEAQFNYILFRNTGTCLSVAPVRHEICVYRNWKNLPVLL